MKSENQKAVENEKKKRNEKKKKGIERAMGDHSVSSLTVIIWRATSSPNHKLSKVKEVKLEVP